MQIHHPTASLIARASTAQDDVTGDGTTSTVLVIGELLKQADLYISEGLHPRMLTEGFDLARAKTLEVLESLKIPIEPTRENLLNVARTSLRTKVHPSVADNLSEICVDAVLTIRQKDADIDLYMVELMEMQHRTAADTHLVRGIVTDHGSRHPDMPKKLENAYILICNVSLEYEKSEVNAFGLGRKSIDLFSEFHSVKLFLGEQWLLLQDCRGTREACVGRARIYRQESEEDNRFEEEVVRRHG